MITLEKWYSHKTGVRGKKIKENPFERTTSCFGRINCCAFNRAVINHNFQRSTVL